MRFGRTGFVERDRAAVGPGGGGLVDQFQAVGFQSAALQARLPRQRALPRRRRFPPARASASSCALRGCDSSSSTSSAAASISSFVGIPIVIRGSFGAAAARPGSSASQESIDGSMRISSRGVSRLPRASSTRGDDGLMKYFFSMPASGDSPRRSSPQRKIRSTLPRSTCVAQVDRLLLAPAAVDRRTARPGPWPESACTWRTSAGRIPACTCRCSSRSAWSAAPLPAGRPASCSMNVGVFEYHQWPFVTTFGKDPGVAGQFLVGDAGQHRDRKRHLREGVEQLAVLDQRDAAVVQVLPLIARPPRRRRG